MPISATAGIGSSSNPKPVAEFDDAFWELTLLVNQSNPAGQSVTLLNVNYVARTRRSSRCRKGAGEESVRVIKDEIGLRNQGKRSCSVACFFAVPAHPGNKPKYAQARIRHIKCLPDLRRPLLSLGGPKKSTPTGDRP
jgi:hypothetical protein